MNKKLLIQGFSLLEMMVVVVIIGILSAIAIPIYTNHIEKANITDASTALININQKIAERKLELLNGNLVEGDITTIISKHANDNSNVSEKYTITAKCDDKDDSCLNYRIFAEPQSGKGLKKSVWLGSSAGLYICDLASIENIKNASENEKCAKQ